MSITKLTGLMDGKSWEESPLNVPQDLKESAPRLTQVKTDRSFKGDVEGTGVGYYQMVYHPDAGEGGDAHHGSAKYSGLQYFSGELKGVGKGTITLISTGSYAPETGAVTEWISDPASGTGDFKGLKLKGGYTAKGQTDIPLKLELSN